MLVDPLQRSGQSLLLFLGTALFFGSLIGCEQPTERIANAPNQPKESYLDDSITELDNLGWLGAWTHPVAESFAFEKPGKSGAMVSPGGIVIGKIEADSVAAKCGLLKGDVVVGIEDEWLPIKDNATMDFIRELENQVAGSPEQIKLKVLRRGTCESISIPVSVKPLDEGLPFGVKRFTLQANSALNQLVELQNDDGSFGNPEMSDNARLSTTSLAGLAMLAIAPEQSKGSVEKCLEFIAGQIDQKTPQTKNEKAKKDNSEDGHPQKVVMTMNIQPIDMDPATTSHVLMFLGEANVPLMGGKWMPRIMGLLGGVSASQHESGGWNVSDDEVDVDVVAIDTTNLVLTALGMLERKGMQGNPETIKKSCAFLKKQHAARQAANLDRRIKSSLAAGSASALALINCEDSDPFFRELIRDGFENLEERVDTKSLSLWRKFQTALLARQTGEDNWIQFHSAAKYWLASLGGSGSATPDSDTSDSLENDASWNIACDCLILSLQEGKLKKLIAETQAPMMVARNSDGEKSSGAAQTKSAAAGMPAGGQVISLDMSDLGDIDPSSEDFMEKLKEKLKEKGISTDNIKVGGAHSKEEK